MERPQSYDRKLLFHPITGEVIYPTASQSPYLDSPRTVRHPLPSFAPFIRTDEDIAEEERLMKYAKTGDMAEKFKLLSGKGVGFGDVFRTPHTKLEVPYNSIYANEDRAIDLFVADLARHGDGKYATTDGSADFRFNKALNVELTTVAQKINYLLWSYRISVDPLSGGRGSNKPKSNKRKSNKRKSTKRQSKRKSRRSLH
jgi:hypothetical protein